MKPKKYFRTGFEHDPNWVADQAAKWRLIAKQTDDARTVRLAERRINWMYAESRRQWVRKADKSLRTGKHTSENEVPGFNPHFIGMPFLTEVSDESGNGRGQ